LFFDRNFTQRKTTTKKKVKVEVTGEIGEVVMVVVFVVAVDVEGVVLEVVAVETPEEEGNVFFCELYM